MKDFVYQCFHDPFDVKSRIINGVFSFLIIFSIAVLPLNFLPPEYDFVLPKVEFIDKITVTLFLIEYIFRIWSEKNPFRFIFSWSGLIDLVAILPFFLEKFGLVESVGMFLILRIFRIFKFVTIFQFEQVALCDVKRTDYDQLHILENEQVKKIVFRHPIVFLIRLILPIALMAMALFAYIGFGQGKIAMIIGVFLFLLSVLFFAKAWLDFNYDSLFITNYRLILQDHQLFGATVNALRYESIVNIVPDNRGILEWIFNYGKIEVETANDQKTQIFTNIRDPHSIANEIETHRQRAQQEMGFKSPA